MEIWIKQEGEEYGPYTLEQVKEFVASGESVLEDEAWFEGCEDYLTVGDIPTIHNSPKTSHKSHKNIFNVPVEDIPKRLLERGNGPNRDRALLIMVIVYRVLAVALGILTMALLLDPPVSGLNVIFIVFSGIIGVVTFLASAEGILVFLDIEENTRKTAENTVLLLRGTSYLKSIEENTRKSQ